MPREACQFSIPTELGIVVPKCVWCFRCRSKSVWKIVHLVSSAPRPILVQLCHHVPRRWCNTSGILLGQPFEQIRFCYEFVSTLPDSAFCCCVWVLSCLLRGCCSGSNPMSNHFFNVGPGRHLFESLFESRINFIQNSKIWSSKPFKTVPKNIRALLQEGHLKSSNNF